MINSLCITPSPDWDRGNGLETQPGIEPSGRGDVTPNLPALAGTPALQGGEEVRESTTRTLGLCSLTFLDRSSRAD
jgi:hypothetical protein